MANAILTDVLGCAGARFGRRGARSVETSWLSALEQMEPRVLLTAFVFDSWRDRFDLPTVLHDLTPPAGAVYERFGHSAARLADLDGDGIDDFAIGAPGSEPGGGSVAGAVFVYSGASGNLLRTLTDDTPGFGTSILGIEDVNGDGVPDILIGSPRYHAGDIFPPNSGAVWAYSGASGAVIAPLMGGDANAEFGYALALIGDITGDGRADFAIGAPGGGPNAQGRVHLMNGITGIQITSILGENPGDRFGHSVVGVGDIFLDDAVPDILIGAPAHGNSGAVYVFDGAFRQERLMVTGENAGDMLGAAVGVLFATPGQATLIAGAPGADLGLGLAEAGRVYRVSLDATLETVAGWQGAGAGHRFGETIVAVGDVDGDGIDDVVFGAPGAPSGERAHLFGRGGTQRLLASADIANADAVFLVGDVNGDGFADVAAAVAGTQRVLVLSSLAVAPGNISVVNYDLSLGFANTANETRFVVVNGVVTPVASVPGLVAGDLVLGANNAGDMVVRTGAGTGDFFLIRNGIRVRLQDAIISAPSDPAPDFASFEFVAMSENGDIIFSDQGPVNDGAQTRSWLLRGDTLVFLWGGTVVNVNAGGTILGVRDEGAGRVFVLRAPAGSEEQVTGVAEVLRVTDAGSVVALNSAGQLVTWTAGNIVVIATTPAEPGFTQEWHVLGVDAQGRMLVRIDSTPVTPGPDARVQDFIFVPGRGLVRLETVTFDVDAGENLAGPFALGEDGTIVSASGLFVPVSDDAPWVAGDGALLWVSNGVNTYGLVAVNQFGDPVLLRRVDGQWHGWRIDIPDLESLASFAVTDVRSVTDAQTGWNYALLTTTAGPYMAVRTADDPGLVTATPLTAGPASTMIVGTASAFASPDRRIHFFGSNAAGELVMYFQNDPDQPDQFIYVNLTQDHVIAQGGRHAAAAGNVEAFVTPWGAIHLFYLDDRGGVVSVWWAPGLLWWVSSHLSEVLMNGDINEDPSLALDGRVTAYITSWRGLNVVANRDGVPTAVWWVPQFVGEWRIDPLVDAGPDTPAFDPDTVTSYTTSWDGLNVASIEQNTGDIAVFWWVPGFARWETGTIAIQGRPAGLTFTGRLSATVAEGDTLNIFARGSDGDVYRIFWMPGFGPWQIENVTESAAM